MWTKITKELNHFNVTSIWFGFFTPTEGAGAGAFIGLMLGIIKGMRFKDIVESILSVGKTSAPILLLLVTAALYSEQHMTLESQAIASMYVCIYVAYTYIIYRPDSTTARRHGAQRVLERDLNLVNYLLQCRQQCFVSFPGADSIKH